MAGYSTTPLSKKLGIKAGERVLLLGAPRHFDETLAPLPEDVAVTSRLVGRKPFDVIVAFVKKRADLEKRISAVRSHMAPAAGFWIAWPKRASGVPTDVTEDVVRDVALPTGLVDNKVCAIDETWSGLRLVIRLEHRTEKPQPRARPTPARPEKAPPGRPRLNAAWHQSHRMPKNPTTEQRLAWHVAHEKNCGCRPMPAKLRAMLG